MQLGNDNLKYKVVLCACKFGTAQSTVGTEIGKSQLT